MGVFRTGAIRPVSSALGRLVKAGTLSASLLFFLGISDAAQAQTAVDTTAPTSAVTSTVTMNSGAPTSLTAIPMTVQFSEPVQNFSAADIIATSSTLLSYSVTNFAAGPNGQNYTFDFNIPAVHQTSAHQASASVFDTDPINNPIQDLAGNQLGTGQALDVYYAPANNVPSTPASVSTSFTPSSIAVNGTTTLNITIDNTNGAAINGFELEAAYGSALSTPSITSNTCQSSATISAGSITFDSVDIAAGGTCAIALSLTGAQATQGAVNVITTLRDGQTQVDSDTASITVTAQQGVDPSAQIAQFSMNRAQHLLAHQPDLLRGLSPDASGSFGAQINNVSRNLSFSTRKSQPVWGSVAYSESDAGGTKTSYAHMAVGAHLYRTSDAFAGIMLQYDSAEDKAATGEWIKGDGWLIGPYFGKKLAGQNLYFGGSALFGNTDNTVSPLGTYADDFSGQRVLLSFDVEGRLDYDRFALFPNMRLTYLKDSQDAFLDTFGTPVQAQSIEMMALDFGVDFEVPVAAGAGELTLLGGLTGQWQDVSAGGGASAFVQNTDRFTGRVDLGLRYLGKNGVELSGGGFVAGIGSSREIYGAKLDLAITF